MITGNLIAVQIDLKIRINESMKYKVFDFIFRTQLLSFLGVGKSTLALRMISDANLVNLSPTVGVSYLETIV